MNLEDLRKEIDAIDHALVELLAKRVKAVKKVGDIKASHGLPIIDEKRREELLQTIKEKAKVLELSEQFVEKLFQTIHDHAVELQKKV